MNKLLLFLILIMLNPIMVFAENNVNIHFFYGQGCSHCASMEVFLEDMVVKYPTLNILRYEVYSSPENAKLLQQFCNVLNAKVEGIPTIFIADEVFVGFSEEITNKLDSKINTCLVEECIDFIQLDEETLNCTISDSDPINPDFNSMSLIGWIFIALVLSLLIYYLGRRK